MPQKWSLGYHQRRWSYDSDKRVHEDRFPDPKSLVHDLHHSGFKAIWMLDPGIKDEAGYFVYDTGSKSDVWIQKADGGPFVVKDFISNGVDGIWNDMNEPAVFKSVTKTMPESNIHRGDDELGVFLQGLSGQPLSGPDIGGFGGNATPKLFGRWMGIGAMFPFCRGHSEINTIDHEPWSFGEECEEVCRLALKRRYCLMPYIYTLFYMAHKMGTPVATPTFFADPRDPSLRKLENSFLLGSILVYASTVPNQGLDKLDCTLPKGIWVRFDFDDSHPDLPALYLQGGSIIPLGPPHQHLGEANPIDDLSLLVALDEDGKAEGVIFEDEGDGYGFTRGEYLLTHYVAELQSSVITVRVSKTEGLWKRPKRRLHVQLLLGGGSMKLPSAFQMWKRFLAKTEFRSAGCSEE
ncbi:putative glucan 1,3-alpha-glucosidase [Morella rubra]|uniref:Putative glucan 1,3-alpha-glucosidase n=1 Tax=Morella rubra TaxID=262757 RepID=A0A6A1VTK2_9ROSI|nr:putative glucan 1,3-alpha-glucosidase [Morella rubra]